MSKSFKQYSLAIFLFLFTLISDQVSKILIVKNLYLGEIIDICPFFNIVRVQNRGVTFGILRDTLPPIVFVLLSLIVVWFLANYAIKNKGYVIPASLIIGGALGNVIDRIIYKSVIDFLDFHLGHYHWPAFNIADSAIVIGVFMIFLISYLEEKNGKTKQVNQTENVSRKQ